MNKLLLSLPVLAAAAAASATPLPNYPTPGAVNPAVYSFTAAAAGPVIAYFAGHEAGYTNLLGLLVNGATRGSPASTTRRRRSARRSISAM